MGYQVVCHTVSCGAYEIADNFDRDLLTKKKNACGDPEPYIREHYKKDGLNGGEPYHLCARTAWENYVTKDFPKVRGYGFEGLHYNDELTAIIPEKCYDKNHPVSWEYHRKVAAYCRDLFGGFQTEGYMDYMNEYLDAALYIGVQSRLTHEQCALFDEGIPFWQLVYHGIVLSNPTSQTVNYPVKEEYQHLKFLEYGGRPVMYFYSKFGADRNWMTSTCTAQTTMTSRAPWMPSRLPTTNTRSTSISSMSSWRTTRSSPRASTARPIRTERCSRWTTTKRPIP